MLYEPSDINDELDEILGIVAIDTDRFVYVESMKEDDVHIGVIQIELNSTNTVFLNELDSQKLDVIVDNLILSYDIQLGSHIYLSTSSHFVIYNFENFQHQLID